MVQLWEAFIPNLLGIRLRRPKNGIRGFKVLDILLNPLLLKWVWKIGKEGIGNI